MKRRTYSLLFAGLLLLVRNAHGNATQAHTEVEPATETRQLQKGDKWVYRITRTRPTTRFVHIGNVPLAVRSKTNEFSGTMTVTVVSVPDGNGPTRLALRETLLYRRQNEDVDRTWLVYFEQEPDNSNVNVVVNNPKNDEPARNLCLAGKWSDGLAYTSVPVMGLQLYYLDSAEPIPVVIFANTVAGAEQVSVKAGKFKAWKVSRATNGRDEAGVITSENAWYAPEIGLPVKLVRSIGSNGSLFQGPSKLSETWELVETSVGKGSQK